MRTLLLALALLASAASAADDAKLEAGVFEPARAAPDFSLRGSDATELKLSRYRGKAVVLAFGFSSCADVCPVTLAVLAEARKKLGAEARDLQVIYITVDPERDDAKRLRDYLAAFDPTFIGGTGEPEQLAAVRDSYGVFAKAREGEGGFSHSSYIYLIDREGKLRALMPFGHDSDDYVHDVRILLKQ